ncbi:MAG: glycosyltransferase, partial [Candidatus Latescibacteria bacterium]|nr:glycosyltransferase [Candidatus Latescibacterota bacterium]
PRVIRIGRRIQIPSNGSRATIGWRPFYRDAVRPICRERFDVIHVHSPLEPFLPWAVLREARAPCVGTFHNAGPVHWGYRHFRRGLQEFADRLDARTAVSRCAARYVGRHFPGPYRIVPNGVDTARFRPNGASRRGRRPVLLFVGRLEKRKGIDLLVEGVARASEGRSDPPRLVVVGDGSLRHRLLRRASRLRVDLRWIGPVAPEELPRIYRASDLFLAPALFGESFGIVLLEALASGVPVVASAIEGYAELLDRCGAAVTFRPGDPDALAAAIARGLDATREERVRRAARGFAAEYGWGRLVLRMEAVYSAVLGGAQRSEKIVEVPSTSNGGLR